MMIIWFLLVSLKFFEQIEIFREITKLKVVYIFGSWGFMVVLKLVFGYMA